MDILSPETMDFIARHASDDVRQLAFLTAKNPLVDMPTALNQIRGRQIASRKLPSWAAVEGIVYPPHLSMEQCSGEPAARYKGKLVREKGAKSLADLTGGLGVDFSFMAKDMVKAIYVERQDGLCRLAQNNFPLLGLHQVEIRQGEAEEVLNTLPRVDLIYLDPARRDQFGGKTYAIGDCTPDVCALKEELLQHAETIIIKLSPMLDWHAAVESMRCGNSGVTEVHIISTGNECKELLLVMSAKAPCHPKIYCVNDETVFSYDEHEAFPPLSYTDPHEGDILLVPNSSVMKAGCFTALAAHFQLRALAPNSHLFLGEPTGNDIGSVSKITDTENKGLPFRLFHVKVVTTLNKKSLRQAIQGIQQANIAVRNFPLTAEALRRKLKLGDGGDTYIFGTTTTSEIHILLICEKISV